MISLSEIKIKFDELIDEKISRELVANWAKKRQEAEDIDQLEYVPSEEEERIWKCIVFLMGVDLRDIDGEYLHSIYDFIDFRNRIFTIRQTVNNSNNPQTKSISSYLSI